ncbi:MAG: HlyD family type I secretion periplasmic adaptor subunit [Gammaproteobacteria bacterium]|nr:MAG: HlyD family type I secretion periplasmic adaptor subunit [Gammaproteobacteria bacterium]
MNTKTNQSARLQALHDLWLRYKTIFLESWSQRQALDTVPRLRHEYEFLPATLALQETPVHPAPQIFMRLIILFCFLLILWSVFGKLDVVASATGKIVPDSRSKIIQPFEIASVHAIHVVDGQVVKAGDNLIELDATVAQADIDRLRVEFETASLDVAMYQALLVAQEKNINPNKNYKFVFDVSELPAAIPALDIQAQNRLAIGQFEAYKTRVSQLAAAVIRHEAEQRSTQALVERDRETLPIIQQREADMQNLLTKNFVSRHDYLELKTALIEQSHNLEVQQERLAEINASKMEAERESKQFYAETSRIWLDKLHEAELRTSTASQELIKANTRGRFMQLKAPVDGVVQQLAVHTLGGVVTPAQPLMTIVPSNGPIEIEAYLSNKDIGFVRPGQKVEVKIETFSFTKYGTITGEVISVSSDAIQDEKMGLVFATRVRLAQHQIMIDGNNVNLSPGMAVTVEIKTTQRRVIEFFFDPLMRHTNESLRER